MTKFDKLALNLGWEKVHDNIPLFYRYGEDYSTVAFSLAEIYESYNQDDSITEDQVGRAISMFSHNKFKDDKKSWIIPMLTSDYFVHKGDIDSAIEWAKIARKENPNLPKHAFINLIKEKI